MYPKINHRNNSKNIIQKIKQWIFSVIYLAEAMFIYGIIGSMEMERISNVDAYLWVFGSLLVIGIVYLMYCLILKRYVEK